MLTHIRICEASIEFLDALYAGDILVENEEKIKETIREMLIWDTLKEKLQSIAETQFQDAEDETLGESRAERWKAFVAKATDYTPVRKLLDKNFNEFLKTFPLFKNHPHILLRIMKVSKNIIRVFPFSCSKQ